MNPNGSPAKKAVHVKWAGKTIALGTFPSAEADEKCARAKALTRAWRSTMRPKPSRDWVMLELERLGVRIVSGRLGRKAGEDADGGDKKANANSQHPGGPSSGGPSGMDGNNNMGWGPEGDLNGLMMQRRRNSSLGLNMDSMLRRGSLNSLQADLGGGDNGMARSYVGGGAAAAYEAARHDHFAQNPGQRRSSIGLGSIGGNNLGGTGTVSNQHYEMLKLHHMNLLNEIQETTLMMNLYQQQQLQQQQQQLQQQASAEQMSSPDPQMAMLLQQQQQQQSGSGGQQGLDPMFGSAQLAQQQRASLGLGGPQLGSSNNFNNTQQELQMMQQQMNQGGSAPGPTNMPQQESSQGKETDKGKKGQDPPNKRSGSEDRDGENKRVKTEDKGK